MKSPRFHSIVKHSRRASGGFTLMEMIIVLTIIALLMGLAIFNLTGFTESAQKQKVKGDILTIKEELSLYQLNCGSLPTNEQGLKALVTKPTIEPVPQNWISCAKEETLDPWGHPYQYRIPARKSSDEYDLFSMGKDGLPDTDDDIGNWQSADTSSPSKP
jgi:general secretion pathway protein G